MSDFIITAPAASISGANFLRSITGRPLQSAAEIAEADARRARVRLYELIQKTEYAQAGREREAIIRGGYLDGETYEEWRARLNEPFIRAAQRVDARMREDRKAA